ncbi:MAG: hypothetical protein K8T90_12860 [Planctomycetes bacterium]|nr:hypothetical protein [Planctomycetota bacterium]
MPLYRTMIEDPSDHLPEVGGSNNRQLGVRVPQDVRLEGGVVQPTRSGGRAQGMSVFAATDPAELPPYMIPLRDGGTSRFGEVFEIEGDRFADPLACRPERAPHHVVGPLAPLGLDALQTALGATRRDWRRSR